MCGISGLINRNGDAVSPVILKKMTDAIAHRGLLSEIEFAGDRRSLGARTPALGFDPT